MLNLTQDNFENEVKNEEGVVLIDFWAPWCGPCKRQGPIFEELATTNTNAKFAKVNVDDSPEISGDYGVMGIPTIIAFKNGKPVAKHTGLASREKLIEIIENALK